MFIVIKARRGPARNATPGEKGAAMKTLKVVIPGGSGQVGTVLARALHHEGHDVVVLSRRPQARPWRVLAWDGATRGDWSRELDGATP